MVAYIINTVFLPFCPPKKRVRIRSKISPQGSLQTGRAFSPTRGRILSMNFFYLFFLPKCTSGSSPQYPLKEASKQTGLFPLLGGVYYQYIFSTFLDGKKALPDPLQNIPSRKPPNRPGFFPCWGAYIINIFFPPFWTTKKRTAPDCSEADFLFGFPPLIDRLFIQSGVAYALRFRSLRVCLTPCPDCCFGIRSAISFAPLPVRIVHRL